jgi:hypothetical protein
MEILAWCGVGLLYLFMFWLIPSSWAVNDPDGEWWFGVAMAHLLALCIGGGGWGLVYLITH